MAVPDTRELRVLLARYADARITLARREDPAVRRELERVSGALCAMTGTRAVEDALPAADRLLAVAATRRRPVAGTVAGAVAGSVAGTVAGGAVPAGPEDVVPAA
ncbi:DUF5133 domain-containing protein [Streptomyces sp. NPDC015131]|uniref:DUF5133 domain-containing protein n=1 Tax=Streptomyces sp. NPDC015131 TaxID=3364941 RepID=UPI0037036956